MDRNRLIQEITEASERDQALAHKLIRRQHGHTQINSALWLDGILTTQDETARDAWAIYCENLAHSETSPEEEQLLQYMRMLNNNGKGDITITSDLVIESIKNLKKGKAMNSANIIAEHLKNLPPQAINLVSHTWVTLCQKTGQKMLETKHRGSTDLLFYYVYYKSIESQTYMVRLI